MAKITFVMPSDKSDFDHSKITPKHNLNSKYWLNKIHHLRSHVLVGFCYRKNQERNLGAETKSFPTLNKSNSQNNNTMSILMHQTYLGYESSMEVEYALGLELLGRKVYVKYLLPRVISKEKYIILPVDKYKLPAWSMRVFQLSLDSKHLSQLLSQLLIAAEPGDV